MDPDLKKNHKYEKNKIEKKRRNFLKKAAYAAPTLVIMGQLVKPTGAHAEYQCQPDVPEELGGCPN